MNADVRAFVRLWAGLWRSPVWTAFLLVPMAAGYAATGHGPGPMAWVAAGLVSLAFTAAGMALGRAQRGRP